jgi:hypothetical protein
VSDSRAIGRAEAVVLPCTAIEGRPGPNETSFLDTPLRRRPEITNGGAWRACKLHVGSGLLLRTEREGGRLGGADRHQARRQREIQRCLSIVDIVDTIYGYAIVLCPD